MITRRTAGHKTHAKQPANKPTPIYIAGRVIGNVSGNTFSKFIAGSKHLLRSPRAICFDRSTLQDAAAAGATYVEVHDWETSTVYEISFDAIHEYSFPVLRGHGDQVGVELSHWSINGAVPVAEQRAAQTNKEREELQLNLFEGVGQ